MYKYVLFVLTIFGERTSGLVPFLGKCPNVETVTNFHLEKYLGKWYEAEKYFLVFEFGGKCLEVKFSAGKNGSVDFHFQELGSLTGFKYPIEGHAKFVSRNDEPKLIVKFSSLPIPFTTPSWVLGTDYDNYAVIWSCLDFGLFSIRNAWILTRARKPTLETMEKAYKVVEKNGISRAYFFRTDQHNCPDNY